MPEEHGLRRLGMGRAGQNRVALALGQADESVLEADERTIEPVNCSAGPEAQVRRDLVVARAAGVELPGDRTQPLGQRGLEVHVDVLESRVPGQLATLDLTSQLSETVDQSRDLGVAQDAGPAEAADMGDRAIEVIERHLGVDLDRSTEGGDPLVAVGREPSTPEPHPASSSMASQACPRSAGGPAAIMPRSDRIRRDDREIRRESCCNDGASCRVPTNDDGSNDRHWPIALGQQSGDHEVPWQPAARVSIG